TFDGALDNEIKINPDGLRAGIAAPGAARDGGYEKQAKARHDEQAGDVVEFLRPDFDEEEIEAAIGKIDQHRLIRRIGAAIPAQPWRQIVAAERNEHDNPLEAPELALNAL